MLSVKLWEVGPVAWSHLHQMCQQSTFLIYSFHNFFVILCILDFLILNPQSFLSNSQNSGKLIELFYRSFMLDACYFICIYGLIFQSF